MQNTEYGIVEVIEITADLADELISIAINNFGCSGAQNQEIWEEELNQLEQFPSELLTMSGEFTEEQCDFVNNYFFSGKNQKIQFFFEGSELEIRTNAAKFLEYIDTEFGIKSELKIFENEEWRDSYKQYFIDAKIDDELVVLPDWNIQNSDYDNYTKKLFLIPGMGFGTGGHETTRICLSFLNSTFGDRRNLNVLDLGCGSGILGNFCEKYLNSTVDYVDVDEDALKNCKENRELNQLPDPGMIFLRKEFHPNKNYDLVIANILKPVLEMEASIILEHLKENGQVILSGILLDQYEELLNFYKNKFQIEFEYDLLSQNNWVGLRLFNIKEK